MKKYFLLVVIALVAVFSSYFNTGVSQAAFQVPKNLAQYIPAGFVIDENFSSTKDYGMYEVTGVLARKDNVLPKPFKTPEKAVLSLGFMVYSDPSYNSQAWTETQRKAEEESQQQTALRRFIGKEAIRGGGTIYWYQCKNFNIMSNKDEASELDIYYATINKQINKGVLNIKLEGFVGDRDTIRKCFQ